MPPDQLTGKEVRRKSQVKSMNNTRKWQKAMQVHGVSTEEEGG